jgi:hypothetical protein
VERNKKAPREGNKCKYFINNFSRWHLFNNNNFLPLSTRLSSAINKTAPYGCEAEREEEDEKGKSESLGEKIF